MTMAAMDSIRDITDAPVLVVDDDDSVGRALARILRRAGFADVVVETDPRAAIERCAQRDFDAILLDLHMPGVDGFEVMDALAAKRSAEDYSPILVLTGDQRIDVKERALVSGARDFVEKPFEPTEVVARLRNLVETRRLNRRLQSFNAALAARVSERTEEVVAAKLEVLERLARAGEYRDDTTGVHAKRVGTLSGLLARELGLDHERAFMIEQAAPLHDIGKIGIPDAILLKQGGLNEEEVVTMRRHTVIGAAILSGSRHDMMQTAERIALTHHEHWNGRGYPQALRRDEIPLEGRIVAVADAFDSLTNDRPYRRACSVERAVAEILKWRTRQFAPDVVDALLRAHAKGVVDVVRGATVDEKGTVAATG